MSLRSVVTFALVFALVAPLARAQDQSGLWRSFAEKLPPGTFVVVQLSNGRSVQGRLVHVSADAITVLPKKRLREPARVIAFADLESIDARDEGMSPGAKVLIGVGSASAVILVVFALLLPRT